MDKAVIRQKAKTLLGIADASKDSLLDILVDTQLDFITTECNDDFTDTSAYDLFPKALESVLVELVILRYRLLGSEGKTQEKLGDYSFSLMGQMGSTDVPKSLMNRLYRFRQMRVY